MLPITLFNTTPWWIYDPQSPLLFNSGLFLLLFTGFFVFYALTERLKSLRVAYVTLFSLYFYYKCSGWFVSLLLISSVWDYTLGLLIHQCGPAQQRERKLYLWLSVIGNLGLLGYFKYSFFFVDTFNQLLGSDYSIDKIFLPAGISFYTFQTLSYSIDIYRGNLKPTDNFLDFAFFVGFFPQLVAGPIVRAVDFMPQIRANLSLSNQQFSQGLWLIMGGLFKKAVVSDFISGNFVDRVFQNPFMYSGFENLLGVYGYTIQIYCDFSGYSDMAIGLALLMGFHLPENFRTPYQSRSITEFWRRWHQSLSFWLRDYLYIALGGNRGGRFRTYFNLMMTMVLGGLWHGANWKFVFWGTLHGFALAIERMLKPLTSRINGYRLVQFLGWFWTFHFVAFCWIFFRAESFERAGHVLQQIYTDCHWSQVGPVLMAYWKIAGLMLVAYVLHFVPQSWDRWLADRFEALPLVFKALALTFMIWLVIQFAGSAVQPFIYFQF
jgi:D-alanyl-lipoteichoic acid acyltransferase DltB (MBOAT superfamily)